MGDSLFLFALKESKRTFRVLCSFNCVAEQSPLNALSRRRPRVKSQPHGGAAPRRHTCMRRTWKYGICRHCTAVGRLLGSQAMSALIMSTASGLACGMSEEMDVGANCGKRKFMLAASLSPSAFTHQRALAVKGLGFSPKLSLPSLREPPSYAQRAHPHGMLPDTTA